MRSAVCVLCGHWRPITREHVPPKNLFLSPRPRNTLTVPVCKHCNESYDRDDEYFRIYVAAGAEPGTVLARLWTEGVIMSSLKRSPPLRSKLGQDRDALRATHEVEPVRMVDGSIIPDSLLHLAQPFSAERINRVVEKIIRCLHFHHTKERLPSSVEFKVSNLPHSAADGLLLREHATGQVGMNGEFIYRSEVIDMQRERWLLSFYDKHTFEVVVTTPVF